MSWDGGRERETDQEGPSGCPTPGHRSPVPQLSLMGLWRRPGCAHYLADLALRSGVRFSLSGGSLPHTEGVHHFNLGGLGLGLGRVCGAARPVGGRASLRHTVGRQGLGSLSHAQHSAVARRAAVGREGCTRSGHIYQPGANAAALGSCSSSPVPPPAGSREGRTGASK